MLLELPLLQALLQRMKYDQRPSPTMKYAIWLSFVGQSKGMPVTTPRVELTGRAVAWIALVETEDAVCASVFAEVDIEEAEADPWFAVSDVVFVPEASFNEPVLDSLASVEFEVPSDVVEAPVLSSEVVSLSPFVTVIVVVYDLVTVSTTLKNLFIPTVTCWTGMSVSPRLDSGHLLLEGR
jgi:hypothetical protein